MCGPGASTQLFVVWLGLSPWRERGELVLRPGGDKTELSCACAHGSRGLVHTSLLCRQTCRLPLGNGDPYTGSTWSSGAIALREPVALISQGPT